MRTAKYKKVVGIFDLFLLMLLLNQQNYLFAYYTCFYG